MKLYFGGAEIPSHLAILDSSGIEDVYLSYTGIRARQKSTWLIADHVPAHINVLLDSGCFTYNKPGMEWDDARLGELAERATEYEEFVAANIDRVAAFTEFDAVPLGLDWVMARREDFYSAYRDKLVPVWHAEWGLDHLSEMAGSFGQLGVVQTALGDRDIVPLLNMLVADRHSDLYGLGITKPRLMRAVKWHAVSSTSWLSPMQYGDTQIWTGRRLTRYPKKYKGKRKAHGPWLASNGFDVEKILADDKAEVARLALWSWGQLMEHDINRAPQPTTLEGASPPAVPAAPPARRERKLLPVAVTGENLPIGVRGDNLRRCDSCYLRDRGCPGYEAGAACLYELPIEVRTPSDVRAVEAALLAMQTQRVMFMKMVEDLEGGFPDPNLSGEMDRLARMIKLHRDGSAEKFNLSISANRPSGEAGLIGSIFGQNVAAAQAIEPPTPLEDMVKESLMGEVFDGEVID